MIYNKEKQCVTNDDGSLIKPSSWVCSHPHTSGHGCNTYRCSSINCMGDKKYMGHLVKELNAVPGGLDGLYQIDGHYRSEHLDKGTK